MDASALSLFGQRDYQAYQISGKIDYQSYQYAKIGTQNAKGGQDIVEFGQGTKVSIEFSMTMIQERTQSKIDAACPNGQVGGLTNPQDLDTSPEATAERIVQFATGFLGAYQAQHPEMTEEEAANNFMELIRGAIDEGFGQARQIIESMNSMTPELDSTINDTYNLVQQKLDDFFNALMEQIQSGQTTAESKDIMAA